MLHYRLYCLDDTGRFFRCDEYSAADDDAAIADAKALRGAHPAELWCGARMVTQFAAIAAAAAPLSGRPALAQGA